ncbi:hypothetical protein GIB67_040642 [Kingdonia uniflora]|uniref:Uncharacterized protein n=1 Tax=Kingdonia uniflora TaxID=39325 RepID=A0A7J7M907_9MAGN|nr:hypothetical protein GIB67_040642 [Kingdonia uniflora]
MRAKFISKSGNFSMITKGSSIWAGVRGAIENVRAHSGWVIGDGASIDLWRENWCSPISLIDWINNDCIPWNDLHAKELSGPFKTKVNQRGGTHFLPKRLFILDLLCGAGDYAMEGFLRMTKCKEKVLHWLLDTTYARTTLNPFNICSGNVHSASIY